MTKVCPAATTAGDVPLFQIILTSPLEPSLLFGSLAGFLRIVLLLTSASSSVVTFYRVQPAGQKPGVGSYGACSEHSAPFASDCTGDEQELVFVQL